MGHSHGIPFLQDIWLSPLNSVPKPDSDERLFILDLSWPAGASVNDGISKDLYLGQPVNLRYPMVDDIFSRIVQFASGCLLYKRDLKCAYHQLPVDPYDYPLLGYSCHDQLYFDVHLPMGQRWPPWPANESPTRFVLCFLGRVATF